MLLHQDRVNLSEDAGIHATRLHEMAVNFVDWFFIEREDSHVDSGSVLGMRLFCQPTTKTTFFFEEPATRSYTTLQELLAAG